MLIILVHAVLLVAAIVLSVLALVLLIEVAASLARRRPTPAGKAISSYAVVIPAHDEVGTIEHTLAAVLEQIGSLGRVLVVADNCTDDTAAVSAAAGAEVITRLDPHRRGKGYALGFAVRHLAANAPEVVIILDADCIPEAGTIEHLVAECHRLQRPLQARYDLFPPGRTAGPLARVGAFAWRVKNVVRPMGLANLGLPCLLMGTGMAFPWSAIVKIELETGHLVEDMVFGLELTAKGLPPLFLPEASVRSALPPSVEGQTSQRTRWETGHLRVIAELLPRFFVEAMRRGNAQLFAVALEAAIPPLAFLVLLLAGTTLASGLIAFAGGPTFAMFTTLGADVAMVLAVTIAWLTAGRELLSPRELITLPGYVAAKLPLYARALTGSKIQWVRSKRD
ncbi:MAG: glycosyltransferase family 2 protein [Hyphomicrobiaceae bacterium]